MRKIGRKILSGLLCGALIIGLVPGFGSEVKAADYDSTIKASELSDGQSLNVSKDTTLVMDKDLTL